MLCTAARWHAVSLQNTPRAKVFPWKGFCCQEMEDGVMGCCAARWEQAGLALLGSAHASHPAHESVYQLWFIPTLLNTEVQYLFASLPVLQQPVLSAHFSPLGKINLKKKLFLCKGRKRKSDSFPEATEFLRYPFQGVYCSLSSRPLTAKT